MLYAFFRSRVGDSACPFHAILDDERKANSSTLQRNSHCRLGCLYRLSALALKILHGA